MFQSAPRERGERLCRGFVYALIHVSIRAPRAGRKKLCRRVSVRIVCFNPRPASGAKATDAINR